MAQPTLSRQTECLIREYGVARVLDARRLKLGEEMQPVRLSQSQESSGPLGFIAAIAGAGLLAAIDRRPSHPDFEAARQRIPCC